MLGPLNPVVSMSRSSSRWRNSFLEITSIATLSPNSTSASPEWVQEPYADCGRPSIDSEVFVKLQLVMVFEGLRSERQLMRVVADQLSLRWYLGYDLNEPMPDHSSLTRIRDRYGLDIVRRVFEVAMVGDGDCPRTVGQ